MESRLLSGIGVVKGGLQHLLCSYGTPPCCTYTVRTCIGVKQLIKLG